mgnify:CR=1 FL=1
MTAIDIDELVAIDVETGHIFWKRDLPHMALGGATVVNDLVFGSTLTGQLFALDRATGELISANNYQIFLAVSIILMSVTPFVVTSAEKIYPLFLKLKTKHV